MDRTRVAPGPKDAGAAGNGRGKFWDRGRAAGCVADWSGVIRALRPASVHSAARPRLLPGTPARFTYRRYGATWRSGYAAVCKTVYPGSIPGVASKKSIT